LASQSVGFVLAFDHGVARWCAAYATDGLSQTVGNAIVLNSPGDDPSSRVVLTLLPPGRPQGEVKAWFANQALALAQAAGRPLGSTEVMEQEGILVRVVRFENQNYRKLRAVFYGYPTRTGFTVAVLMIPPALGDQDARLETGNRYVQELAVKRFELAVSPTLAVQPGPPASVQPHTDMDLTYHAKPIPPKERDVPLKGVYVFVGFAFGPSYGGVGTTMTWSQKPSQQLLLLFANSVAAKVDLRGRNLAGKYQAEGFATMDVGNPAAVSSAPFVVGRMMEIRFISNGISDLRRTSSRTGRPSRGKVSVGLGFAWLTANAWKARL
jgi:hypothetical protein